MPQLNTISIKYNGVEYTDDTAININSDRQVLNIQVGVNGSYDCNDFDVEYNTDWITHKRIRNFVDIIVEPNSDFRRRETIIFRYRLNRAISIELDINQDVIDYSILVGENEENYTNNLVILDKFDTLTEQDSPNIFEKEILIKCNNGVPFISQTKEYAKIIDDDSHDFVRVKYDNGLNLQLIDNTKLLITSYGKANLYYDYYYIVTIKNRNSVYEEATIKIGFNKEEDIFSIK